MTFEWDEEKNTLNKIKHGVSFEEAETVFDDENAAILFDDSHSSDEERFVIIGIDAQFRELTVCHCYRGHDGNVVRIISARKATSNERSLYWRGNK